MTTGASSLALGAAGAAATLLAWRLWRQHSDASASAAQSQLARVAELEEQLRKQAQQYEAMIQAMKRENEEGNSQAKPPQYRVVLTGGPCGGKTTALSEIKARLEALGFLVLCIPEAATLLFSGGCPFPYDENSGFIFQKNLLKLQMAIEEAFSELADASGRKTMMLFDRGLMDGKAYMSETQVGGPRLARRLPLAACPALLVGPPALPAGPPRRTASSRAARASAVGAAARRAAPDAGDDARPPLRRDPAPGDGGGWRDAVLYAGE